MSDRTLYNHIKEIQRWMFQRFIRVNWHCLQTWTSDWALVQNPGSAQGRCEEVRVSVELTWWGGRGSHGQTRITTQRPAPPQHEAAPKGTKNTLIWAQICTYPRLYNLIMNVQNRERAGGRKWKNWTFWDQSDISICANDTSWTLLWAEALRRVRQETPDVWTVSL